MSTSQNSISVDRNAPIPPGVTRFSSQSSHPLPTPDSTTGMHKHESVTISTAERQILSSPELKSFLHSELKKATEDFHLDNLLGEGGFGLVYKGWLDEKNLKAASPGAGIPVAVKKLKPQGLQGHKEWLCEVEYLGRLHHLNLVKLLGFCLEGENRLLVYEYMPQGSLENHLFRRSTEAPLSWETRVKIAIGAARGLCFLHDSESQIIYRDFKASNILLDSEFNAKLSDFGLAKKGPSGDDTHVTTAVMGTEGYAAPEYITTGKLSTKCDVYSFGVVLFEMLTGRRAVDYTMGKAEHHLLHWVKPHLRDKRSFVRIMDSRLEGQYPRKAAFIAATLALHCVNHERKFRPTMSEVLGYLEFLESPKFMSLPPPPPPPPLQKEHIDHQTNSPPDQSPETLGSSAASSPDWPATTSSSNRATPRLSSPPKPHRPNRRCSPAGPRQPQHRSRFSGSFVTPG